MLSLINHNDVGEVYLFTDIGDEETYTISDAIVLSGEDADGLLSTNPVFLGDVSGDGIDDFAFNANAMVTTTVLYICFSMNQHQVV